MLPMCPGYFAVNLVADDYFLVPVFYKESSPRSFSVYSMAETIPTL